MPYQWKVLPFGLATAPRVFTSLMKPILFLCCHKGLHIAIYLDDILVLVCSKWAGKRACLFLCSLLVCLGLHINFSKSDLHLSQSFTFLGLCWDTVHMSVSLPPDKLADIQQLALSLLCTPHVTVHKVMSFLGMANFCTNGHSQLWCLCCVIQSDMLSVYYSPTQLFSYVHFSLFSLHQLEGYYSSSSIHSYPPQCGGRFFVLGLDASGVAPSSSSGSDSFSPLGPSRGGPAGIFTFSSIPTLFHFGNSTASGGLGVECLQPSLEISGKLCVSSSGSGPSCSVQVSSRTCQWSTQTFTSGGSRACDICI